MKLVLFNDEEYKEILDRYYKFLNSIAERNPRTRIISYIKIPELNELRVHTSSVCRRLIKVGLTKQEWVNLHMFGDKDIVPLCPYCKDKPLKFDIWDYRQSCCSKRCKSEWLSNQYKTNEEFKKKSLDSKLKYSRSEEGRKRRSEISMEVCKKLKAEGRGFFSEEAQNKIRSDEYRKLISKSVSDLWKDPEYRNRQSESHKKTWENEETADRLSSISRDNSYKSKKSNIYSEYEKSVIDLDSSWERSYFIFMSMNRNDIKFIRRKKLIGYLVKYFNSGKNKICRYRPDFLVEYTDGRIEMIEIKPKYRMTSQDVIEKKEAAEKFCSENGLVYKILTEIELIELGVLDERCHPLYE